MSFPTSHLLSYLLCALNDLRGELVKLVLPPAQQPHDEGEDNTYNNAGSNRKVKTKVFLLNSNISGKPSDERNLAPEQKQPAYNNHNNPNKYQNLAKCA